jgi:hypothetical protein
MRVFHFVELFLNRLPEFYIINIFQNKLRFDDLSEGF